MTTNNATHFFFLPKQIENQNRSNTHPTTNTHNMATPAAIKALEDTTRALKDIRVKVQPLLATLRRRQDDKDDKHVVVDPHELALARAGVALTAGTLRFLAQRLRGCKATAADPLRAELNRMRQVLVQVQKKAASSSGKRGKRVDDEEKGESSSLLKNNTPAKPPAKRRRTK